MTLRMLIVVLLFAIGTLPLALSFTFNLPQMLKALEQANLERIEGALRRDLKLVAMQLSWREENLRQFFGHPGTRELAMGVPVTVPLPVLRPRMEQMYVHMYDAAADVGAFRLVDAAGRVHFSLVRREGTLRTEEPGASEARLMPVLAALPATGAVRLIEIAPGTPENPASHAVLAARLSPPKPGSEGGFILLDINLAALLADDAKHLLLRGDGVSLNGPSAGASALTDFPGLAAVLAGGRSATLSDRDRRRSHIWLPLYPADQQEKSLWIAGEVDRGIIERLLSNTLLKLLGIIALLALLVLLGARWLADRFEHARNSLTVFLSRLLAGETPEKLPWRSPRELRQLGEELQRLADTHRRLLAERQRHEAEQAAIQDQLIQAQKLESVGGLAAGIAHDFNNILAAISGHGQMALIRQEAGQTVRKELEAIRQATERASQLTRRLLLISRREPPQVKPLALRDLIIGTGEYLGGLLGRNIHLRMELPDDPLDIVADGSMIEQVLLNLVDNARDAMPAGGEIVIRGGRRLLSRTVPDAGSLAAAEDFVFVAVSDSGEGIDEATRARIFEPCFTTKPRGKGSGLGLAVAQSIVGIHHGWIEVESSPGQGSTFSVYLPAMTRSG